MTRRLRSHLALLLAVLIGSTGCHPTQPFYLHEDGDLSHYLDKATDLEYADVYESSLEEVTHSGAPLTLSNPEFQEIWDLTLEEAVSIALQNSRVIRNLGGVTPFGFADALIGRTGGASTIYDAAISESDPNNGVEAALAAFDAQFSILGSQNGNLFTQNDRPSTFQPNNVIRRDLGGLRTELSKQSASGAQYFFRNQTDYTRGDNLLGGEQPTNSVWETVFEVEVRQPLLQGRGAQVNRIPVVLARINTDISLATFEASVRNLVLDIENTYWDLHCAYRALETAKAGRDSAQVTWHKQYQSMRGGIETSQAEAQSREQYYFFRGQLEQALRDLYDVENRLRFLMGIAATDGRLIRPSDEPTTARVHFDWRQIHCEALARSSELRQQKWVVKRRELELIAARNRLLPQLDVGATYRWYGVGDHLINADRNGIDFVATNPDANPLLGIPAGAPVGFVPSPGNPFPPFTRIPGDPRGPVGSTAFDVLTNGHYQEAAFFFSFQMPVGYRRELAGVRNAQLNLVRETSRLEDMELNTSHLLTSSVRSLDFNYTSAQTQFNRWRASQEEVEAVEALYLGEKITLDLVLDAQRRRAQAQNDYYRVLCEYNKAIADVHFRKGSLLEYNNIFLAEGPWPDKAYWDALGHARERDASYYMNYGWTRPKVVSQGPIPQHAGDQQYHHGEDQPQPEEPGELVPTPEPTPAEPGEDQPQREPGPVTNLPEGPMLNAPRRAQVLRDGGQVAATADPPANAFDWGSLGGLNGDASETAAKPGNPLRHVSHEE